MAAPCASPLQPPPEQGQVHYISDNVFTLGTLSCAVCGHSFPLHTSPGQRSTCSHCGALHEPGAYSAIQRSNHLARAAATGLHASNKKSVANTSAALLFGRDEIRAAVAYIRETLDDSAAEGPSSSSTGGSASAPGGGRRAGTTEVDNRIIEEAYCETCERHQPCKTFARQTRSADEGQTIFFQCTKCGSEWQQNS